MWRRSFGALIAFSVMALVVSPVLVLQGCGGEKDDVAIAGSSIAVNPQTLAYSIVDNISQDFVVTVKYPDGTPYPKANVRISGAFAAPRNLAGTTVRYQFYFGPGGELGPDPKPVDSGFTAQTDDAGNYTFSITVYGTVGGSPNVFTDVITITSGGAASTVDITFS